MHRQNCGKTARPDILGWSTERTNRSLVTGFIKCDDSSRRYRHARAVLSIAVALCHECYGWRQMFLTVNGRGYRPVNVLRKRPNLPAIEQEQGRVV